MHSTLDELARTLASAQHGIFHVGQLGHVASTRSARRHRVQRGDWIEITDGVYRLAGTPSSWEADALAACWAGGPLAVASHRTAAALWRLPGRSREPIEITCRRWRRTRTPVFIVHETKALGAADRTEIDAIPVTTAARTLLDLGAVCGPRTVEMAIDAALRRELVSLHELEATLARLGRSGRNGAGVLRTVLELRGDRAPTESEMESLLLTVLAANGLPPPVVQCTVLSDLGEFVATVDAAYPSVKLAIEYESYEHHIGRLALVRDSARRNELIAIGWTVITATAVDLQTGGRALCRAIRSCLERHQRDFGVPSGRPNVPQ